MKPAEIGNIFIAIILLTIVSGLAFVINSQWEDLSLAFAFSAIIIFIAVLSKKLTAYLLDADVEHEIWEITRLGLKKSDHFKKPFPAGILLPLIISIITLGTIKFSAFLTFEARALKYRASKRFGFYSYTEMTDWHNALIGASSAIALFLVAIIAYFLPIADLESLSKMSIYYIFWNLLPISKLDGTQIFFGSRILWAVLATITLIATMMAIITI